MAKQPSEEHDDATVQYSSSKPVQVFITYNLFKNENLT